MPTSTQIRAVLFQEGDHWVAQCLEYDIGCQAPDLETLQARLEVALDLEARESARLHGTPFAGLDQAPQHFHDLWEKRAGDFKPTRITAIQADRHKVGLELAMCA